MYEKEVQKAQERLNAALTLSKQQPEEAINMILDMKEWVDQTLPNDVPEYYGIVITYYEVIGDLRLRARKFVEAEQNYKLMVQNAVKLYETDKEKYDLRLGMAYVKLANNCRSCIGCHVFSNQPRKLDEKMQRPFDAGLNFYKTAIGVTQENAKKGSGKHLELRSGCLFDMAVMNIAVGNYYEAEKMMKESINIQKAIYQTLDNKEAGAKLGNTLITLATVYSITKKNEEAMETLEDAIYVLGEHEEEDPVRAGILIARSYMNLAGCYVILKQGQEKIDDAYTKATKKISMVNAIAKNSAAGDEITCYMLSGNYYLLNGDTEKGKAQLNHALELATKMYEATKAQQFEAMKTRIKALLEKA